MGIYDRDYFSDDRRGAGWLADCPATKIFLLLNVAIFIVQVLTAPRLEVPSRFETALTGDSQAIFGHGQVWRLLTSAFLHRDPFHLLFNMLLLWWLGRDYEASRGTREFAATYLLAAVFSALAQAMLCRFVLGDGMFQGASGAVAALFTMYAMQNPRREILLFFILPVPVWACLALFGGGNALLLLGELSGRGSSGLATGAHLGGMLFGWATLRYNVYWGSLPGIARRRPRVFRPKVRVVAPDDLYDREMDPPRPTSTSATGRSRSGSATATARSAPAVDDDLDARLDAVLAKIARDGRGSLTPPEEEILEAASRRARKRRETRR